MSTKVKFLFAAMMMLALIFGYMHLFVTASEYNFERLHIFLFNLCSGGTIILYFSERKSHLSKKTILFLALAICYAILAFFKIYIPAMIVSILLACIVESVRIEQFSFFPAGFFRRQGAVSNKFHQASLLCLSSGLVISSLVILNNEYLKLISMPKLQLDVFFLGFSFPVSLITMSVIFSFMNDQHRPALSYFKEFGFWSVNLGVIIFFMFIIFEKFIPQVFVTAVLFFTVILILFLYLKLGLQGQQKNFLTSGMAFLVVTAVTGILYIFLEFSEGYEPGHYRWLLKLHSFASLYGWNLCGLAVICRYNDFPIQLHSPSITALHWVTVTILAPLGYAFRSAALVAVLAYGVILYLILFSQGKSKSI